MITPDVLRQVFSRFPTGVAVVTTGRPIDYGITVNSITSLSLDPVLVQFAVKRSSSLLQLLRVSGPESGWGVSFLTAAAAPLAEQFARPRADGHKFARVPFRRGSATGAPLLDTAVAALECRTWAEYDGGDHIILVGQVVTASLGESSEPLVTHAGGWARVQPARLHQAPVAS